MRKTFGVLAALALLGVAPAVSNASTFYGQCLDISGTAIGFETSASGRRVSAVSVGTPGGPRWRVRAKRIVLAGGAVENARLLLVLNESRGRSGDGSEWVPQGSM